MRRDHLAVNALSFLREPLDERSAVRDLALRLRKRLALLGGEEQAEIILVRHHQVVPLAQDRGALLGSLRAPRGPRAVCCFHRALRFGRSHVRNAADRLAGGGVVDLDRATGIGARPRAIEVALLAKKGGIFQRKGGEPSLCGGVHRQPPLEASILIPHPERKRIDICGRHTAAMQPQAIRSFLQVSAAYLCGGAYRLRLRAAFGRSRIRARTVKKVSRAARRLPVNDADQRNRNENSTYATWSSPRCCGRDGLAHRACPDRQD